MIGTQYKFLEEEEQVLLTVSSEEEDSDLNNSTFAKKTAQNLDENDLYKTSFEPRKYMENVSFMKWITFLDIFPDVKRINSSRNESDGVNIPLPNNFYNIGKKIIKLNDFWTEECRKEKPSFPKALIKAFLPEILWPFVLDAIAGLSTIFTSLYVGEIISLATSNGFRENVEREKLIKSVIILILLMVVSYCAVNWEYFLLFSNGAKARLTIISLLYKKLNSISLTSLHEFNIGKMINLIANDLNDIDYGAIYLPMTFCLYLILIGTFIMWGYFGPSCLLGLGVSVISLILQIILSKLTENLKKENTHKTDQRVKFTNEMIENIRLIKMYAWEKLSKENIESLRMQEDWSFRKINYIDALGRNMSIISGYLSILLICMHYIDAGGVLSPDKIYASMIILNFISANLMDFHKGRMFIVSFSLILQRVREALLIKEVPKADKMSKAINIDGSLSKGIVIFHEFTAYWDQTTKKPCLSNITLTINPGSLTTIIGKIGSGKSTFLLSLLQELPVTQGTLKLSGKIAYVEQEPIIFSATVRENILFGKDYDFNLYNKVLEICKLNEDLDFFPCGDLTIVGERGITLSGGQKARLSLARAIYSESDIYLLDDPFSAVDSRVAQELFNNGLKGELLKDKTIILVTHRIDFARDSDLVLVMNEGKICARGPFKEIEKLDIDLLNIFRGYELNIGSEFDEIKIKKEQTEYRKTTELDKASVEDSTSISWKTYIEYIRIVGTYKDLLLFVILFTLDQALVISYTRLIGKWAVEHISFYHNNKDLKIINDFDHTYYLRISWILLGLIFITNYLKRIKFVSFILSTNSALHSKMLSCLTQARILFFDINPIGRVVNRFSNDMGILDKQNILNAFDMLNGLFSNLSVLLTVCFINPLSLVLASVVVFSFYLIKQFFTQPILLSKKLELSSRSPIYSSLISTLNGLTIIRVYNQSGRFIRSFFDLIYEHSKALFFFLKVSRLFGLFLDAGLRIFIIGAILTFLWLVLYRHLESGLVGLSFLFLFRLTEGFIYSIRLLLTVDVNMQSAERLFEYCVLETETNQESDTYNNTLEFKEEWPTKGDIIFHNVYLKYRPEVNYALNGLSFSIKERSKVACIGRTGAGKSSIIQALFRMVEIENSKDIETYIKIDGVDIRKLPLNMLRKGLSIIPQTPVVFSGTIRRNLDPFGNYTDQDIWEALEEVGLKDRLMGLPNRLETDMTISSSVFSVGQKQLICLARAILKKTKVIILDEPTANIDIETDEFIQKKVMQKFADCTVLTIAHRLITIANYDKVIVMDRGQIIEYDNPYSLLVNELGDDRITRKDSVFASMVIRAGKSMSMKIFNVARQHYFNEIVKNSHCNNDLYPDCI